MLPVYLCHCTRAESPFNRVVEMVFCGGICHVCYAVLTMKYSHFNFRFCRMPSNFSLTSHTSRFVKQIHARARCDHQMGENRGRKKSRKTNPIYRQHLDVWKFNKLYFARTSVLCFVFIDGNYVRRHRCHPDFVTI